MRNFSIEKKKKEKEKLLGIVELFFYREHVEILINSYLDGYFIEGREAFK